ncbi:MAG: hypothetical protein JXB15_14930 [Anaerolineales bacterium]|nr:hypothetical protein [Anaerolineales bacterium]
MDSSRPLLRGEIDLAAEAERLAQLAAAEGITMRLLGALAFWMRCPRHRYLHAALQRAYTDLDFIAPFTQKTAVEKFFAGLGFIPERSLQAIPGLKRSIFHSISPPYHVDLFYDELDMCHRLDLRGRLQIDPLTIPVTDLLLEKLQIVQINHKDLVDLVMLLLEYPLVENDETAINLPRIVQICQADWGWTRTLTINLGKVSAWAKQENRLSPDQSRQVFEQAGKLLARIAAAPKSLSWRLRALVGERVRWYREVEQLY